MTLVSLGSAMKRAKGAIPFALLAISGLASISRADAPRRFESAETDPRWSMVYVLEHAGEATPMGPVVEHSSWVNRGGLRSPINSPDVAVKPASNRTQSEISVAIHPTNPNLMLVGANATDNPVTQVFGTGTYWSTNGGTTWTGNDLGPGGVGNSGDPAAVIGSDGRFMMGYISSSGGMGVSYSTNQGATWTHRTTSAAGGLDKNHLMVDNVVGSAFNGIYYNTWVNLGSGANVNDIEFSRSTDGGFSWSAVQNISNGVNAGSHNQGCNNQVGPNGEVYVCWAIYDGFPADETAIGFNKSTNGGVSWVGEARKITGIRGHRNTSLPNTTIRRNSFPSMAVDVSNGPNRGAIYIVWTNVGVPGINTGTDASIWMSKSTNGGTTFSTPTKVNNDAGSNSQFFPWISCDPVTGQLAVIFYDRRDDPGNSLTRAYMATSNNGGTTWDNFAVGDVSFTPTPIPGLAGGYMGDYLGISMVQGKALPSWTDNRTGNFLCYVSPILVSDPTDPNPPTALSGTSNYLTPTSVNLTWNDPSTYTDGSPLTNFSIDVLRDDVFVANVDQNLETYTDPGLIDGQLYKYTIRAKDDVTDSLSTTIDFSLICGGSKIPGAPSGVTCSSNVTQATIGWTNPVDQADGNTLDDFAGVRIFRNGALLVELARAESDTGTVDSYVDTPPANFFYVYEVAAIDNEAPVNQSAKTAAGGCFVGTVPQILVWKAPGTTTASADSAFAALQSLGESCFMSSNLTQFGADLNAHQIVLAHVGVQPGGVHAITTTEGNLLQDFVDDGGRLYLEGGDCFSSTTAFNVKPIVGVTSTNGGAADLVTVTGENDMNGFLFTYGGSNASIDRLVPTTSVSIWRNVASSYTCGVFNPSFGVSAGRAIGASFEFGGLTDTATQKKRNVMSNMLTLFRATGSPIQVTSTSSLAANLFEQEVLTQNFTVSNPGSINAPLTFTIAENPPVDWLVVSPSGATLNPNGISTINANYVSDGLAAGVHTTQLVVSGNDPGNPTDTINVTLTVSASPDIAVAPASLTFDCAVNGGVDVENLTITNNGEANLNFSLAIPAAGGGTRAEFASQASPNSGGNRFRGNVYEVLVATPLKKIEHLLNLSAPSSMEFFVYENTSATGTFTKVFSTTISAPAGPGFKSSGVINFPMQAGRFYFIGAGWAGSATYYSNGGSPAPPVSVPFGLCRGAAGSNTFPTPTTQLISSSTSINSQAIEFGETATIALLTPATGSIPPGGNTVVSLQATGGPNLGTFNTTMNITSNDPNSSNDPSSVKIVPITVNVFNATDAPNVNAVPTKVALYQSVPNPFRDGTAIRFDLPVAGRVSLRVYDLAGRLVRTLVDGTETAGSRTVRWDGKDSGGQRVSSGVYFYSLQTPEESIRMKTVRLN